MYVYINMDSKIKLNFELNLGINNFFYWSQNTFYCVVINNDINVYFFIKKTISFYILYILPIIFKIFNIGFKLKSLLTKI